MAVRKDSNLLADNRRARRQYELTDRYEAGMVLTGAEVKSCRAGKIQLTDSYATIRNGEVWLHNAHISAYTHATIGNAEPVRSRKLLLHRKEINKLEARTRQKGLTLIPTHVYSKNGHIKCGIALAKSKRVYDKRDTKRKAVELAEAREAVAERRSRKRA